MTLPKWAKALAGSIIAVITVITGTAGLLPEKYIHILLGVSVVAHELLNYSNGESSPPLPTVQKP